MSSASSSEPSSTASAAPAPPVAWPIWANGSLFPRGTPVIEAEDRGFLLGLAVFDSVLLEEGCIFFLEQHLDRLRRGGAELGIRWPLPWDPAAAFREIARALGPGTAALMRMTLSLGVPGKGPSLVITCRPPEVPPAEGVSVHVSKHRKLGTNQLEGLKSTNRLRNILARDEAQALGAWEALLPNDEGDLSEGTISNLFVVEGGALRTPATDRGCLWGITRQKVLEAAASAPLLGADGKALQIREERIEPEHLRRADEVFLTSTSQRVLPVLGVIGLDPPVSGLPGARGPVARQLAQRVEAIEEAYRQIQPSLFP